MCDSTRSEKAVIVRLRVCFYEQERHYTVIAEIFVFDLISCISYVTRVTLRVFPHQTKTQNLFLVLSNSVLNSNSV